MFLSEAMVVQIPGNRSCTAFTYYAKDLQDTDP
jgi:hypothetical protein